MARPDLSLGFELDSHLAGPELELPVFYPRPPADWEDPFATIREGDRLAAPSLRRLQSHRRPGARRLAR